MAIKWAIIIIGGLLFATISYLTLRDKPSPCSTIDPKLQRVNDSGQIAHGEHGNTLYPMPTPMPTIKLSTPNVTKPEATQLVPSTPTPTEPIPRVCGVANGTGVWPWRARLSVRNHLYENVWSLCDAVLIGAQYVLTTADCVHSHSHIGPADPYDVSVYLDHDDREYGLAAVRSHSNYSSTAGYDIAILKLNNHVELNDKTGIICLPAPTSGPDEYAGEPALLIGSGHGRACNNTQAQLAVWNDSACTENPDVRVRHHRPGEMCTGFVDGIDVTGWYGAPLTYLNNVINKWIVIGLLVSVPYDDTPGGYTRVSDYIDWIIDNTRD